MNSTNSNPAPNRVLLLGYPYFVNCLKDLGKNSELIFETMPKYCLRRWIMLLRSDLIYLIGGDLRFNRFFWLGLCLGKKIIIHWVGSDVLEMQNWRRQGGRFSRRLIEQATHWAEIDWIATELKTLGVESRVVSLTPAAYPADLRELPDKFMALTYLPSRKAKFYGEEYIVQLARDFPEIVILAVAATATERPSEWPANLISVGWVNNMVELYPEVTVLIRMTEHDGLSFMVLEALAQARHVIWSYPLTGVSQATNASELKAVITELYQRHQEGRLGLNLAGRKLIEENYNPQMIWKMIYRGICEVLQ